MFWDGTKWVDDRPGANPQRQRRRVRDWLATMPILLLVPVLLSPFLGADAASAQLAVSGVPAPGAQLSVRGSGLPTRAWVQLTWDGSPSRMPANKTSSSGTMAASITVPKTSAVGQHVLSVIPGKVKGAGTLVSTVATSAQETVLASLTVTVIQAPTTPTPPPAATPTPPPTATPTPPPPPRPRRHRRATPTPHAAAATPRAAADRHAHAAARRHAHAPPPPRPRRRRRHAHAAAAATPTPPGTLTFDAECGGSGLDPGSGHSSGPGDPGDRLDTDTMGDLRQVSVANGMCTINVQRGVTPSGSPVRRGRDGDVRHLRSEVRDL